MWFQKVAYYVCIMTSFYIIKCYGKNRYYSLQAICGIPPQGAQHGPLDICDLSLSSHDNYKYSGLHQRTTVVSTKSPHSSMPSQQIIFHLVMHKFKIPYATCLPIIHQSQDWTSLVRFSFLFPLHLWRLKNNPDGWIKDCFDILLRFWTALYVCSSTNLLLQLFPLSSCYRHSTGVISKKLFVIPKI